MILGSDGRTYGYTTSLLPRSKKTDVEVYLKEEGKDPEYYFTFVSEDLLVTESEVKEELEAYLLK